MLYNHRELQLELTCENWIFFFKMGKAWVFLNLRVRGELIGSCWRKTRGKSIGQGLQDSKSAGWETSYERRNGFSIITRRKKWVGADSGKLVGMWWKVKGVHSIVELLLSCEVGYRAAAAVRGEIWVLKIQVVVINSHCKEYRWNLSRETASNCWVVTREAGDSIPLCYSQTPHWAIVFAVLPLIRLPWGPEVLQRQTASQTCWVSPKPAVWRSLSNPHPAWLENIPSHIWFGATD